MAPDDMQEYRGWLFPEELDLDAVQDYWYSMEFGDEGGDLSFDLDKNGHLVLARQAGLETVHSTVEDTVMKDGVAIASAVRVSIKVDGTEWQAIGGSTETTQQPDSGKTWSVAETAGLKRAVKRALGIRPASEPQPEDKPGGPDESAPPTADPSDTGLPEDPPAPGDGSDSQPTDTDLEF